MRAGWCGSGEGVEGSRVGLKHAAESSALFFSAVSLFFVLKRGSWVVTGGCWGLIATVLASDLH